MISHKPHPRISALEICNTGWATDGSPIDQWLRLRARPVWYATHCFHFPGRWLQRESLKTEVAPLVAQIHGSRKQVRGPEDQDRPGGGHAIAVNTSCIDEHVYFHLSRAIKRFTECNSVRNGFRLLMESAIMSRTGGPCNSAHWYMR